MEARILEEMTDSAFRSTVSSESDLKALLIVSRPAKPSVVQGGSFMTRLQDFSLSRDRPSRASMVFALIELGS